MPPRPARSAKKNISYKIDDPDDETRKRKGSSKGKKVDDSDDEVGANLDDDDSDEYVEPSKDKDDDDYDEDMDIPEEEDEDIADVNDDSDEEEDDEPKKSTKRRRQNQTKSFAVSLDQMTELLNARDQPHEKPNNAKDANMKISPASVRHKMAPVTATQRAPRDLKNKNKMHKKGDMRRSDSLPQSWKLSYQAPTSEDVSHVSMQEDVLRAVVYPNIGSNMKDFLVITEPSDLDEYLPVLTTTKINTRDMDIEMGTMTSRYIETTDKTGINDYYILNTGFSVWGLDWCPLPSYEQDEIEENASYVAVGGFPDTAENCIARDQLYPLGKQDAHPNVIQLWNMNCESDENGQLQGEAKSYLAICILHSYGAVLDLKWCPTGCFMPTGPAPGDLARLGILAASFTDGTIRIFSIPDPVSLQSQLGLETTEGSPPDTIYIRYPEPYATIRLGDVNFMSISWGTANRLAAGATNGTAAIWDMSSMLSQSKEMLAEKDSDFLDPIYLPQVHDVCVRSIDWLRDEDPNSVPWIIATSGYDGHVRYTDLRDLFGTIDIKTILGAPMTSRCIPWAEATVYVDIDLAAKFDQLYLECRGFRLFNAKGTVWDITYSDYQPFLAAGISDGRVKISNPAYKARRGYGMVQNHIYQIQEISSEEADSSADVEDMELSTQDEAADPSQPRDDIRAEKIQMFRYVEGEEKEYTSKSDGFLNFYSPNIAVQKVQWSRSYHSAAWLASGSAGGIVRIDNTLLRKGEGGAENKIEYQIEPYILKKRLASGKAYDEKGRRLGPDGKPVGMGRPRKSPAETAKGKRKTAVKEKAPVSSVAKKAAKGKSKANEDDEFGGTQVEGSSSTVPKRTTRQSGKLAPIFTRALSSNSLNSSRAPSPSTEEHDGENTSQQGEPSTSQQETPSASSSTAKSPEKLPPSKPRGRSKKAVSNAIESSEDADGDIDMAEKSAETRTENDDQTMEEEAGSVAAVGTAKASVTPTRGKKPSKVNQKTTTAKGKQARALGDTLAESTTEHGAHDTPTTTNDADAQGEQGEADPTLVSASSSRASSAAPNSPRKKRGPYKTKKHMEELKRTNHSLKDLWSTAAANKSAAKDDQ
ncbi:hypothetical protein BGX21_003537 [Mortierella sp. AD011]|nr:hypothetical protein BGX20_010687 [Mortierella sp. AD010]KAF9400769.1 hypothetical protein BGX21_003537 [Mortierella sp. AD011]